MNAALPNYISGSVIQARLNDARNGIGARDSLGRYIAKPGAGTYLLTTPLVIYANTHLDVTGVRIVSRFPTSGVKHTMLINYVPSGATGYTGAGNIAITGGSWDPVWDFAQRGVLGSAPAMNVLTLTHCSDVVIDAATIWNVKWWHAVEFNGVRRGTVKNSNLKGWIADPNNGLWHGEAVQLDLPTSINTWSGASDSTPCRDILISGTLCDTSGSQPGWGQLTGSHTFDAAHPHVGVRIEGNTVRNARWDAIATANAQSVHIANNVVENCVGGVYVKSVPNAPLQTVEIIGNQVNGINGRDALAVRADPAGGPISDVLISGNVVDCAKVNYYGAVSFRQGHVADCAV
ncbi:hypothetical protein Ais01nite_74710 [Asanoa ishikariensis]|uniref:right-handed parallel beta-helix repeat-containing protein n=1 Tax=Asanoa ishikariensis TaxID=137265 RepID=UPI00115FBEF9|nr:right-handed parallel beta-helix repeat-containing protein [Asanoa ishikariensis]GIF69436.1 hypothetical protein Ais01nite_74710 [Asanoa ishikariensis]